MSKKVMTIEIFERTDGQGYNVFRKNELSGYEEGGIMSAQFYVDVKTWVEGTNDNAD